jgi:hypothetical protein
MTSQRRLDLPGDVFGFSVPGKAVGYYTAGARPNWTRLKAYRAYRDVVAFYATRAGLVLPLVATEQVPVYVSTWLYCSTRLHHDPENIRKGICDLLFYKAKGGDKHVGGNVQPAVYGDDDRVWVETRYGRHDVQFVPKEF